MEVLGALLSCQYLAGDNTLRSINNMQYRFVVDFQAALLLSHLRFLLLQNFVDLGRFLYPSSNFEVFSRFEGHQQFAIE